MELKDFLKNSRHIRHLKGMKLNELARRTKATSSFLSQAEKGTTKPSLDSLSAWAKALGYEVLVVPKESEEGMVHKRIQLAEDVLRGVADHLIGKGEK